MKLYMLAMIIKDFRVMLFIAKSLIILEKDIEKMVNFNNLDVLIRMVQQYVLITQQSHISWSTLHKTIVLETANNDISLK